MPEKISGHLPVAGILFRFFFKGMDPSVHTIRPNTLKLQQNKIYLKNL
jgi:hypothetical protein